MKGTVFLFGSAEKGAHCKPITLHSLDELFTKLGNPPQDSQGIHYAIQALLFKFALIYFRVAEEGYSMDDYRVGFQWLAKTPLHPHLSAICLPGVGSASLLQDATSACHTHQSLLILSSQDLYDYLCQ